MKEEKQSKDEQIGYHKGAINIAIKRSFWSVTKEIWEKSEPRIFPLNRCYTMRGRSPRVQRHEDFRRKSEAFGEEALFF